MLKFFNLALFVFGFLGYFHFLVNVKKVSFFTAPAIIITSISSVMCISGILNTMLPCVYLTLILGVFLFWKYRDQFTLKFLSGNIFPLILCVGVLGYLLYYSKGAVYADGDTMTHWGIIVKNIYRNDRLPNFLDSNIDYQAYPPATACWIYFFIKLLGYSEARALLAQGLWMFSCVMSMYAINHSRNKLGDILIFLLSLYLMTGLDDLRVDVILSLVTIASIAVVATEQGNWIRTIPLLTPFLIAISLIKNSGILFAYIPIGFAVCLSLQRNSGKIILKNSLICAIIPALSLYLWKAHTKIVFESPDFTMHAFSPNSMKYIVEMKTSEDIHTILTAFLDRWFSWNESYEWHAVILFVVAVSVALLICQEKKNIVNISCITTIFYFVYKISLFLMYVLSMVGDEALHVASYERYQQTFSMIQLFIGLWILLSYVINSGKRENIVLLEKFGCICTAEILLFSLSLGRYTTFLRPDYTSDGIHRTLVHNIEINDELDITDKVLCYHSYFLTNRIVWHSFDNYDSDSTYDLQKIEEALNTNNERYEWLILLEENEEVNALVERYGYSEYGNYIPLIDWSDN